MKLLWTKSPAGTAELDELIKERERALERQQAAMRDLVVTVLNRATTPWPKEPVNE